MLCDHSWSFEIRLDLIYRLQPLATFASFSFFSCNFVRCLCASTSLGRTPGGRLGAFFFKAGTVVIVGAGGIAVEADRSSALDDWPARTGFGRGKEDSRLADSTWLLGDTRAPRWTTWLPFAVVAELEFAELGSGERT